VLRELLHDPASVRAYLLTKVAVLAVAALATWPLARLLGPRAWVGLGVFAALLAGSAAAVLVAARLTAFGRGTPAAAEAEGGDLDSDAVVSLPVEDSLDLHSFAPASIPDVVQDYLEAAHARGLHEVRLIHGRGIGVQRERVRSLLARHPRVAAFHDAPPEAGGWGATVAYLKGEAVSDRPSAVSSPTPPASLDGGPGGGAES
jgi:hypothetical protein